MSFPFTPWGAGKPGVFGSLEPEPLEEKTGAGAGAAWEKKSGAGAAKKLAGSSALLEDKKLKERGGGALQGIASQRYPKSCTCSIQAGIQLCMSWICPGGCTCIPTPISSESWMRSVHQGNVGRVT